MGERSGRWAGRCGIGAAGLALALPLVAGRRRPGYDHRSHYISELGECGAPDGRIVSLGGFLPIGLLSGACAVGTARVLRASPLAAAGAASIAGGVAVGYGVAAVAPCDPGCPATGGSSRQAVHNAAGLVEYLGGGAGLVAFGLTARHRPGVRGLARASFAMSIPYALVLARSNGAPDSARRGLDQRILESILFGWITAMSVHLLRSAGR